MSVFVNIELSNILTFSIESLIIKPEPQEVRITNWEYKYGHLSE